MIFGVGNQHKYWKSCSGVPAKTEFLRQPQFVDPPGCFQKFLLVMEIVRKSDDILPLFLDQFCRDYYEIGADGLQGCNKILLRQAQPFEPVNDIGGQKQDLKEGDVGCPTVGGDLPHRVVVEQFPDVLLHRRPGLVEEVDAPGTHRKVCDKDMVDVLPVFEEFSCLASSASSGIGRLTTTKRCFFCHLW